MAAVSHVANAIELNPRFVVHDYWLVRTLHALSKHMPRDGKLSRGRWAFGGGIALTTAWGFVRRYSEDIDGMFLVEDASHRFHQAQRSAAFRVADWATDDPDIDGFELPCIRPVWISVNKLDALHRRSLAGKLGQITERGRDLYDLWSLAAQSDIAEEIRRRTPELWESAAGGLGRRAAPRPAGGYADSPVLTAGTDAYEALRAGYENAVATTIWGAKPKFETAIKAVRALDADGG